MTHHDIVKKLIGPINPVGDSAIDKERLENLKDFCTLVESLVYDLDDLKSNFINSKEHSVHEIARQAERTLEDIRNNLGWKN